MAETILDILIEVERCKKCKTISGYKKFPLHSHGKTDSEFMLVSEAPGKYSVLNGKYWIGTGGKLLRSALSKFNKELEEVFYLTDLVKCWVNENNKNRKPSMSEVKNCYYFLKREIEVLKPKLILSFGKKVSEYLLKQEVKLKDFHGRTLDYSNYTKILVLYHPSRIDIFRKRECYRRELEELFAKIIENKIFDIERIFTKRRN